MPLLVPGVQARDPADERALTGGFPCSEGICSEGIIYLLDDSPHRRDPSGVPLVVSSSRVCLHSSE